MPGLLEGGQGSEAATLIEDDVLPGLCRICGSSVPRASDPTSCTPSLCSEHCLARAIVEYWAALGLAAEVSLRDGYARLEGLRALVPRP
jgi:hypothetical protein